MNFQMQRLCVWSAAVFALCFFFGFGVFAQFIPPPNPSNNAETVAEMYREHANGIRTGMVLCLYGLVFWIPFTAVLAAQMKRIEGKHTPLTYSQIAAGAALPPAFTIVLYFFANAAFRSDRDADIVQSLNDNGWIAFTGIVYGIFLQALLMGVVVLCDTNAQPIFPRWYGYLSLWSALLYCPASLDMFFQDGVLAWNGLFSWWLSVVAFFAWMIVTMIVTIQAINREEREARTTVSDVSSDLQIV
jgi:hypothetical protein